MHTVRFFKNGNYKFAEYINDCYDVAIDFAMSKSETLGENWSFDIQFETKKDTRKLHGTPLMHVAVLVDAFYSLFNGHDAVNYAVPAQLILDKVNESLTNEETWDVFEHAWKTGFIEAFDYSRMTGNGFTDVWYSLSEMAYKFRN